MIETFGLVKLNYRICNITKKGQKILPLLMSKIHKLMFREFQVSMQKVQNKVLRDKVQIQSFSGLDFLAFGMNSGI